MPLYRDCRGQHLLPLAADGPAVLHLPLLPHCHPAGQRYERQTDLRLQQQPLRFPGHPHHNPSSCSSGLRLGLSDILEDDRSGADPVHSAGILHDGSDVDQPLLDSHPLKPNVPISLPSFSNGYNRLKSDKNDRVYPISKSIGQIGLEH